MEWLGHILGVCLILVRIWDTFLEWWYHFVFPSAVRETSRGSISSPTLGSLCQNNYNVLYKTETSQHFLKIQIKHVKCLHENSKPMFSHRRLPTLLLTTNHQHCCFVFHKPVMIFSERWRHNLVGWWFWSYPCVWQITEVFHRDV